MSSRITGHNLLAGHSNNVVLSTGVKNIYSIARYPQSNGQAEVTNKTLLNYLKRRLTSAKGKWVDELPIAL